MFLRAARWLATAAAVLFAIGLYGWLTPETSGITLGQALENSEKADTLHLRFKRDAQQLEFWHTRQPNRSRWDDLEGNYRIADGAKTWVVREKANEARRVNPPPHARQPVRYFLDLLGVPGDRAKALAARPVEQVREGGHDLLVYRTEVPGPDGAVWLEAFVRVDTRRIQSMRTRVEKAGKRALLGELKVVAYDEPVSAAKFVVADTLTEDGRIGTVADVQGIVSIKPVLHARWNPVRTHLVLRPGDWLRTDARGANATTLQLVKQTGVILGPRTVVELIGPKQIRISEGEIEITPAAGTTIELLGPAGKALVKAKQLFRVRNQQIVRADDEPPWLRGFKGATANEALGSLVALVDGRNVPLTVGYHKVAVDIRDQIARTVIEESFVNQTDAQLEGIFYFPLPQDASISGFGMWIGDNLVEADVVEKQRAREIYETILRERRDPGLLEWSGGNIFKARVFPIPARGEKRIKISYTQVLPLKGSRYRYSYALQSELLQQHPLRTLAIDVKVNSVVPLKSVTSPTHLTRNDQTAHSAHVEFAAQEYTPTRDFEVVVEVDGRQADVVMIPHRRGDDGYFMLQLTPPAAAGEWDRALLPDGAPLQLLILADTSASIDAGQRASQATFIATLLSALTPKDTFNLGACDVTCDWVFPQPMHADVPQIATARDYLAKRTSLGWTNLDRAFATALKQCGPNTQVVYVGDGIVTTGDADPVAFTKRLRRIVQGHPATFHAVSLGSSYEPGVLKAIASVGGGSMRKITSEQGPPAVALELLGELTQPGLRDVQVEFKGFKVARVYPETLANLPAGTQQILLGRYLPEGRDQAGEVIVTGTQGGKPVRFSTRASFKDAEQGNSFIPRLWARMHLDHLLEQGASSAIKDEIIGLSEEYQIITPYTSLLVLETDADRERFKVKRRFQMRDGERFFAAGRDNATFELAQKQMQRAGAWRTALRRSVLRELARLGRDPRLFQPRYPNGPVSYLGDKLGDVVMLEDRMAGVAGEAGVPAADLPALGSLREEEFDDDSVMSQKDSEGRFLGEDQKSLGVDLADKAEAAFEEPLAPEESAAFAPEARSRGSEMQFNAQIEFGRFSFENESSLSVDGIMFGEDGQGLPQSSYFGRSGGRRGFGYRGPHYGAWLNTLFPPLRGTPGAPHEPKSTWPAPARDLAKSLLRTAALAKLTAGLAIARQTDTFDPRWGDITGRAQRLEVVSANTWVTRSASDGGQALVAWCDAKETGIFSRAFQLGRVRAAMPRDRQPPPLELSDHSLVSLEQVYADYTASLTPEGERTLLVLKHPATPDDETRIRIDTTRHVILSIETRHKDKVTGITKFDEFVDAGGSWWAGRIETIDADGQRTALTTQTVKTLTANELDQRQKAELAGRAAVQFLHLPMPSVLDAKKAVAAGKARFEDQFILLLHFHRSQQWKRVFEHLQEAEKHAAGKPGMRWLRSALLNDRRRHEELRQRNLDDAARVAKQPVADAFFLAEYLVGQSAGVLQANEMLALLDTLHPLYEKQPKWVNAEQRWQQQRVTYLSQAGRSDEALRVQRQLATDYPHVPWLQRDYANALAGAGDYPSAYAWLKRVLVKEAKWHDDETAALRETYAQLLQQQGRYPDLVEFLAGWIAENPPSQSAYDQYLSALVKTDKIEQADALALRWLKEAQVPGEQLAPAAQGRMHAAVAFMLGNVYQLYNNRIEERWLAPLAQALLYFARHDTEVSTVDQVLGHSQFARSEEAHKLRKALAGILTGEIATLPAVQVLRLAGWVQPGDAAPAEWVKSIATLRQRWTNEPREEVKHVLGEALVRLLSSHGGPNEPLAFLRLQWQTGPAKHRTAYANQLFEHLLQQPWSAEGETEALALLDKLSAADDAGARLLSAVAALHRLTDRMIDNRIAARARTLEHPEKLTRTELHKVEQDNRRLAREGLADRLRQEAKKQPGALGRWLLAESLYLDVALDRHLDQAAAEAWEVLGAAPAVAAPAGAAPAPGKWGVERALDELLRQRYLVTLSNLAARKGAAPALVERLLKYFDAGIAAPAVEGRWKLAKYQLLVALDRMKELEQALVQWTRQDDGDRRWRVALGYLLAEQGRLPEAIRTFEAVEAADELTPPEYRALAGWYLAQNQRAAHERAAAAVYQTTPEYRLAQAIARRLQPWQRGDGHLPTELDPEVLRLFAVLFAKSEAPQNYLYQLQQFYQASHDFRLLAGLADAVIGHTAARVYPFVQGMQGVLTEVRDEATADEIVQRIAAVRPGAKTVVDQRALDLLEVLVERRAAEVQNQPGPHRAKAVAALQRAFKRAWSPGEPRLMADFLAGLGHITEPTLAAEQLHELEALVNDDATTPRNAIDALHIAHAYARTLNSYQRRGEAIDRLQAALDAFQAANKNMLPVSANGALTGYVGLLEDAGHFARGEKVLQAQLVHPAHAQQRRWLSERLDQLYHRALQDSGEVTLGKGEALYQALNARIQKEFADTDQNRRYQLITLLCPVYRTAHAQKLAVVPDVKTFAFEVVPPILKQLTNNHESAVSTVAQTVHDLAGPRDGIVFLLNEIDVEPRWLRYNNQDGWTRHGGTLAWWRREAKELGDVEDRLLKLVLAELRRDLTTRYNRNRSMYDRNYDHTRYWEEKAPEFAKVAEEVWATHRQSGAAAQYIAEYFYWGLRQPRRAIDILFVAHNQKLLDQEGQAKLVQFLFLENRHGESIAILQPLVELHPENLEYRVQLMHAYFRTTRTTELLALLRATDAFFHAKDRWNENALNRLAQSTLQNELYPQSVAYFKELIPLHERTAPGRGIGDGALAGYYIGLANAYAGLKQTPEAVDAAGGAIVAWGPRRDQRAVALETLKNVLVRAPDLDAFVAHFDKQKQDSAIVRKAIGQAYHAKKEHARAIKQLELAVALQPDDAETRQLLIASFDALGDRQGALQQLLHAAQQARRDLKLYQELGQRYAAAEQPHEAERAYTSIVEMQPTESESHTLLAEVREKQGRWGEAIEQWEQVAHIRALEPTGLLKLAAAQIHENQWNAARATLHKLNARSWPQRFGDVPHQVRTLEAQIGKR